MCGPLIMPCRARDGKRDSHAVVRVGARGKTPGAIRLVAAVKRTLDENHLKEAVSVADALS